MEILAQQVLKFMPVFTVTGVTPVFSLLTIDQFLYYPIFQNSLKKLCTTD